MCHEVLIFNRNEFLVKISNVPEFLGMKQILDSYADYSELHRFELNGIWLFPGSSLDCKELGIQ